MADVIARESIFGTRLGGARFVIEVSVGKPVRVDEIAVEEWVCPLILSPLLEDVRVVHGNSSLQALCLALSLVIDSLEKFKADGGSLTHEDGTEYDLWSLSVAAAASRFGGPTQWIDALRALGRGHGDRTSKAQRAIDLIRELGSYRWAGLYDVLPSEIAVIAWSGPQAPTYPRFPVAKGLNGACVASRKPVIVQDVASDSRYLTTIGGTRGEMIQPVFDRAGAVVGTIDVESDRVNAFTSRDQELLSVCAENISWLWRASG